MMLSFRDKAMVRSNQENIRGFTIPEVIIAGVIMVIICVGTIQTFTVAVNYNAANNLRMQTLSILQRKIELYRSYKFVPLGTNTLLNQGTHNLGTDTSADGRTFTVTATVVNLPSGTSDDACTFKQITIEALPQGPLTGFLTAARLNTKVTLQRVRGN
jgi:type II secretory pathway pseudopilin PulG